MNSGIYRIVNIITNKSYIGSTCNFNIRKNSHFLDLKKNRHHSIYLQNSYNKYGKENFIFEILITCPPEYCIKLEQWFLNSLKPEYNISKTAGSLLGMKHSEETKLKIGKGNKGKIRTPEFIEFLKLTRRGKKKSPKSIEKMAAKRRGISRSIEIRRKISVNNLGKKKNIDKQTKERLNKLKSTPILQYNLNMELIKEWTSIKEASETLKLKRNNIGEVLRGNNKTAFGFIWKKKEEKN